jgi:acetolactate synthase-1/2/3 large subunit
VREQLKIIVIVFNDSSLSLIEIKQQARRLPRAGVALGAIDWSSVAEGFGISSWTAGTAEELDASLEAASSLDGPSLIDVRIDSSGYADTLKVIRG